MNRSPEMWYGIPEPVKEYRFHPDRRWRFDYCWPDQKLAVEVDGGLWTYGRHNRPQGMIRDWEKLNEAAKMGYRVFHFTPQALKKGIATSFMHGVFEGLKSKV